MTVSFELMWPKGHVPEEAGFVEMLVKSRSCVGWWMEASGFSRVGWERQRSRTGVW